MVGQKSVGGGGIGQPLHWTDRERKLWIIVLFICSILVYAARTSLSVSIVEMASEFDWNKKTCGVILSSFFWGYSITQVLGGQLGDRYGGELVLWTSALVWGSSVFSISLVASISNSLVFIAHLLNGLSQGVYFPAIASLLATRVSDENRSFVYALIHSGPQLGSVLSGILGYTFLFNHGWEYMFLLIGMSGVGWGLLLRWLSRRHTSRYHYQLLDSSPNHETTTSSSSKAINVNYSQRKEPASCIEVPWKNLMKQGPVLAMLYASFCEGFFFHLLMSWLPTFFHDNFQDKKHSAWMYNVYPYIGKGIASTLSGWIANRLIQHGTSITTTRKLMEGASLAGTSLCMFSLAMACRTGSADFNLCLGIVIAAFFFQGFEVSGISINPTDLAPSYSGLLFGIMNTMAALPGIFGVSLIGHMLHAYDNWSYVYFMISAVSFSGFIIYSLFASGKRLTHVDS